MMVGLSALWDSVRRACDGHEEHAERVTRRKWSFNACQEASFQSPELVDQRPREGEFDSDRSARKRMGPKYHASMLYPFKKNMYLNYVRRTSGIR